MLAAKIEKFDCPCYLVNTGWVKGPYGTGNRMSLKWTRQIVDAIHDGTLKNMEWENTRIFGLQIPKTGIKDVPQTVLDPEAAWKEAGLSSEKFTETAKHLATLFQDNFKEYADRCSKEVVDAGPQL